MPDNTVQIRVTSDLSKVNEAWQGMAATGTEAAQSVRQSLMQLQIEALSAGEKVKELRSWLGDLYREHAGPEFIGHWQEELVKAEAELKNTKAAVQDLENAQKESSVTFAQTVRSNVEDFTALRRAMYSVFGFVSFGFIISEFGRTADAIQNAALKLGGFDDYLKAIQEDAAKASDAALSNTADMQLRILAAVRGAKDLQEAHQRTTAIELQEAQQAQQNWTKKRDSLEQEYELRQKIADARTQVLAAGQEFGPGGNNPEFAAYKELLGLEQKSVYYQKEDADLAKERTEAAKELVAANQRVVELQIQQAEAKLPSSRGGEAKSVAEKVKDEQFIQEFLAKVRKDEAEAEKQRGAEHQEAVRRMIESEKEWDRIAKESVKEQIAAYKDAEKAMRQLPANLTALGASLQPVTPKLNDLHVAIRDITGANEEANKGWAQSTAYMVQNAASILNTLGAKREYAAVMAIYEAAEGFAALGNFDFWSAAQDFVSSAMYAKVAGTSSHSHNAGGGGGGTQSSYGRGGGGSGGSGGGGAALPGGGGGNGITVHNHIEGVISADNLAQVMAQMSSLAKGGQATLVATSAYTTQGRLT